MTAIPCSKKTQILTKIASAKLGKTMTEIVDEAIKEYCEKHGIGEI